jgi:hypothetical protein
MGLYREWYGSTVPSGGNGGQAAEEGVRLLAAHQRIERSRKLVEDKKNAFRQGANIGGVIREPELTDRLRLGVRRGPGPD